MPVRRGVVGIVYKKDAKGARFLVLHRIFLWKGWEFPKGGVEKTDKTEESALLREIKEEAGLTNIRIGEKLPAQIKYKYPEKYAKMYGNTETAQSVYLVRTFDDKITIPEVHGVKEHDEFKWLPYKEARKLLTHLNQKKALDEAFRILNK